MTQNSFNFDADTATEPTGAQERRMLEALRSGAAIDPLTAWRQLGIYRLSSVVYLLRKAGHRIATERREVTNRFGEPCNVAFYKLEA